MLLRRDAEKEKEGQHPRSIAQIRRANAPTTTSELSKDEVDISNTPKDASSGVVKYSHPTSLNHLCSSEESSSEINIICSWTTPGKEDLLLGQHHLRQLAVRPEFKSKGCPILISAKYDTTFSHDFSYSPLVRVFVENIFYQRSHIVSSLLHIDFLSQHSMLTWKFQYETV